MTIVLIVLLIVATWRGTRLLVKDDLPPVRLLREWFIHTFGAVDGLGKLVGGRRWGLVGYSIAYVWTCSWCMSVWVGVALVALADWRLSVPYPWLIVAAGSGLSGLLGMLEYRVDQRAEQADRELGGR